MKSFLFSIICFSLFISCNDKKEVTSEPEVKSIATPPVDEKTQKIEALKKLTPVDLEQLHKYLPAELNEMKRTNFSSSSVMGYSYAEGTYQKGKSNLQIMIYDCAGEAGSVWYSDSYAAKLDYAQDDSLGYSRTIDLMGSKAIESYKHESRISTLTYMINDRLLFVLSGKNLASDELRQLATKLHGKP